MRQRRKIRRDGFSLVEMMIIIGIIGVFAGAVGLTISLLQEADTRGAAYNINSGLTDLKSKTTGGKEQIYMYLFYDNNAYYLDYSKKDPDSYAKNADAQKIAESEVDISYGTAKTELKGGDVLCVGFQKKDGAFLDDGKCICPGVIYVKAENVSDYEVHMVKDTGHHYVESK